MAAIVVNKKRESSPPARRIVTAVQGSAPVVILSSAATAGANAQRSTALAGAGEKLGFDNEARMRAEADARIQAAREQKAIEEAQRAAAPVVERSGVLTETTGPAIVAGEAYWQGYEDRPIPTAALDTSTPEQIAALDNSVMRTFVFEGVTYGPMGEVDAYNKILDLKAQKVNRENDAAVIDYVSSGEAAANGRKRDEIEARSERNNQVTQDKAAGASASVDAPASKFPWWIVTLFLFGF